MSWPATDQYRPEGSLGTCEDADPVGSRIGLLMIGQIGLVAITGDLYTKIWQRVKEAVPLTNLAAVTLASRRSVSYIRNKAAYELQTFQVLGRMTEH